MRLKRRSNSSRVICPRCCSGPRSWRHRETCGARPGSTATPFSASRRTSSRRRRSAQRSSTPGRWLPPIGRNCPRRWNSPWRAVRARYGLQQQRRVDQCIDVLMNARKVFHSQPTWMYFPELPAIEFFDRSHFPWLDALESRWEAIRTELLQVLMTDQDGLQPYIDFPAERAARPVGAICNKSRSWSAYFLWNQGAALADHMARCPIATQAWTCPDAPSFTRARRRRSFPCWIRRREFLPTPE